MASHVHSRLDESGIIDILCDDSGSEGNVSEDFEDDDVLEGNYIYILCN